MEYKDYIGFKVIGFIFEDTNEIAYVYQMDDYLGKIGRIIKYNPIKKYYTIKFEDNNSWSYPIEYLNSIHSRRKMISKWQSMVINTVWLYGIWTSI